MKIKEVKTAFKIADVKLINGSTKLKFNYLSNLVDENGKTIPAHILNKNYARVYLVVVNGKIKKIGGSQAEGGMKQTLSIYQDGGVKGRPSIRSFGMWYFLYNTLLSKKKIEFYMIYQDDVEANIKGLFGYNKIPNASYSYKLLEQCCLSDFLSKSRGCYPDWNIQEQAGDWPEDVKRDHAKLMKKSTSRKLSKGRRQIKL